MDIMYLLRGADVFCMGSLHWADINPGETVTGSFTVTNVGVPTSKLNWSIMTYPEWGTWSFSTTSGKDLGVGQEETINVTVTAPDRSLRNSTGYIKVINTDNPRDCFIIQVSLATPCKYQSFFFHLLTSLLKQFPCIQSLVGMLVPWHLLSL